MIFLKSLIFILFNLFLGFSLIFTIKLFLFIPKKEKKIFHKKVPFTPAFVHRKKKWLIDKLHSALAKYIADAKNKNIDSRVSKWETKIYKSTHKKLEKIARIPFLPSSLKTKIREIIATFIYQIAKYFFRNFVPYLMSRYHLIKYIELLDFKLDVEVIEDYFNRYIYRFLLVISLTFSFLVGIGNMIVFLILN
ncbi:MAG: hypothetical protein HN952_05530 [Candidatus Cloacimonetes bacterium]|jgi:hypothetical protein|nr:hypothetical protein [Candidatus Cloacimonadota bacterium]MBT6994401.1 hypothetical protein [Candidatus Cloacimonadota bacterium]MBT7469576.1 hypothetical protein [Candidatus Cloacimonadota bacterium]